MIELFKQSAWYVRFVLIAMFVVSTIIMNKAFNIIFIALLG